MISLVLLKLQHQLLKLFEGVLLALQTKQFPRLVLVDEFSFESDPAVGDFFASVVDDLFLEGSFHFLCKVHFHSLVPVLFDILSLLLRSRSSSAQLMNFLLVDSLEFLLTVPVSSVVFGMLRLAAARGVMGLVDLEPREIGDFRFFNFDLRRVKGALVEKRSFVEEGIGGMNVRKVEGVVGF